MRKKEELELYINEHLMNRVKYTRKVDENTNEEYYEGVLQLFILSRSNIEEDELEYVFNSLKEKGIIITGESQVLYGDYENYRYVKSPMTFTKKEEFDEEKANELLKKLKTMKVVTEEDKKEYDLIRKKVITMNTRLVEFLVDVFNKRGEYDPRELESYGYEGLIVAIDKYEYGKTKFSTYANKYIYGYIIKGMINLKGFSERYFYYKYLEAKKELQEELQITIDDDFEYLDEIATKIYHQKESSLDTIEEIKTKISLTDIVSLDEIEDQVYDDNTLYNEVIEKISNESLRKDIDDILSKLTPKQRKSVVETFGLDDDIPKNNREVASILGCSHQSVHFSAQQGINKIKCKYRNIIKLKAYYNSMKEYNYNPNGIESIKIKQKVK